MFNRNHYSGTKCDIIYEYLPLIEIEKKRLGLDTDNSYTKKV